MTSTLTHFSESDFRKQDPNSDQQFYAFPRMVAHIDDSAIAYLQQVYAEVLPAGGVYLDMMSSRYSHLPPSLQPERVHAHGMNAQEMQANPVIDEYIVQNLNENQTLPFEDRQFDAAVCAVSVQYLQRPLEVFTEVLRVLRPGAPFVVSFSNRCFPTKAMNIWLRGSDDDHVQLVRRYMALTGFDDIQERVKRSNGLQGFIGMGGDPLYAVIGHKPS